MQDGVIGLLALLSITVSAPDWSTQASRRNLESVDRLEKKSWSVQHQVVSSGKEGRVSDAEIKRRVIADSIASYEGPCACPYQSARNGSRCGRRSAYNRAGGEAPLCFPSDVSDEMVQQYRAERGLE